MAKTKARAKATKTTKATKATKPAKKAARKAPKKDEYAATAAQMGTVTPYLAVGDAKAAIAWYRDVFGAKPVGDVMPGPGGKVLHAQLKIGDSLLFLSDIFPQSDLVDPTRAGASVNLHYFRPNAGHVWERAVAKGAKVTMPFEDQFWGDQYGKLVDPFGHSWAISRRSKLSKKELEVLRQKAMAEMGAGQ